MLLGLVVRDQQAAILAVAVRFVVRDFDDRDPAAGAVRFVEYAVHLLKGCYLDWVDGREYSGILEEAYFFKGAVGCFGEEKLLARLGVWEFRERLCCELHT